MNAKPSDGRATMSRRQLEQYLVAVSLYDHSLWMIYNAWDRHPEWKMEDEDTQWESDEAYDMAECPYWFLPESEPASWARFEGLPGGP